LKAVEPKCDLHQFTFSDDAVSYASSHIQDIDLFILDIRVPGTMNGLDVAQKVREIGCAGTLVLTSAYQTPERTLLQGLKAEWFPKPWHIVETCVKLLEIVRTKQAIANQTPPSPTPLPPTESVPNPVVPPSDPIIKTLSSAKPAEDDANKPKPSA
jgi:DNA-binding response OmpR family regulator